jgi:thiol-disulfide isomerase/thioredoxin
MNKGTWTVIIVAILVATGAFTFWPKQAESPVVEKTQDIQPETTTEAPSTQSHGLYTDYTPELAMRDGDVVLFFKASWCPTCSKLDANLDENEFPENLTVLRIDYDLRKDLVNEYGINYQHTLVHVNKDGEIITKWYGGYNLQSILDKI